MQDPGLSKPDIRWEPRYRISQAKILSVIGCSGHSVVDPDPVAYYFKDYSLP